MNDLAWKNALSEMIAARCTEVDDLAKRWIENRQAGAPCSLDALEIRVREWALKVGLAFLERLVAGIQEGDPKSVPACLICGGTRVSEGMRTARLHSCMGEVKYTRRYWVCSECGTGVFPLDEELGLDAQRNSPALQRMVSLAGTVAAFDKGSELLQEIGSIPIAGPKVERITEQAGERAQRWLQERQQQALAGLIPSGEPPADRLYVEADGTTVPMRRDGDSGERTHQRTPGKVEYKEVKLGAVFHASVDEEGKPQSGEKTYTGTFGDAETCVRQVQAEAAARGSAQAQEIVLLCDGGTWLWNRLPEAFAGKKVTQILDCRHPQEKLAQMAKLVFGEGTSSAQDWSERQRQLLLDGGVQKVIQNVEALKPRRKDAKEFIRQALGYLRDNQARMNYGELRARGYFIGSGIIESACKHIVGDRFKRAGMHWSREHVPKLLGLRVCRASGWWDPFWSQPSAGAAA